MERRGEAAYTAYPGSTSPSVQWEGIQPRGSSVVNYSQPRASSDVNSEAPPPPSYQESVETEAGRTTTKATPWTGFNTTLGGGRGTTEGWTPSKADPGAKADLERSGAENERWTDWDDECQECCLPFVCMLVVMTVIGLIIWAIVEASEAGGGGSSGSRGYSGGGGCFPAGTALVMEDGSYKAIEDIRLGESLAVGGRVQATMQFEGEEMFLYNGVAVGGAHTVYHEPTGTWSKIAAVGTPAPELGIPDVFFDLITEHHRILVAPPSQESSSHVLFADYAEIDWSKEIEDYELSVLNSQSVEIPLPAVPPLEAKTCAQAA